jgi:hypothetical protein
MRRYGLALASLLLLSTAPLSANAQKHPLLPVSDVTVAIGPHLQAKAEEYGQDDLNMLARELKKDVEDQLRRKGRLGPNGLRLALVITDAKPDHPTMEQMRRQPGLDYMHSVSRGAATIDGEEIQPNGTRRHVHFDYEQLNFRDARTQGTWGDAENTFDWFAREYAAGKR